LLRLPLASLEPGVTACFRLISCETEMER
jgi:hypothetical protein